MSKKTLIIVIAVLAVILVAGLIAVFMLSNQATPDANDDQLSSINADDTAKPNTPEQGSPMTTPDGELLLPDDPATPTEEQVTSGSIEDPTSGSGSTNPTKGNETAKDPTSPTKGNTTTKDPTTPTQNPTAPTQKPQATEPEEAGPLIPDMPDVDVPEADEVTYEEYYAMSAEEQAAFINSFESYEAFFAWHKAAKEAYENNRIEIDGSTPIDLGEVEGGN